MSSPDNEQPEGPPKGPVAPVESPGPDDAATAADQEAAADRGEVKAPGAPAEPTSDTEGAGADSAAPQQAPPETTGGDTAAPDEPGSTASAGPDDDAATATTATQPGDEQPALAGEGEAADAAAEAADVPVAEEPDDGPPPFDETRSPMLDLLRDHLGDAVLETHLQPGVDVWARVRLDAWDHAAEVCRDRLGLTYFCFLSAIDWLPSPFGKSEDDAEPSPPPSDWSELEHGVAGGATRFQLLARLQSPTRGSGLTLKADLPDDDLRAPTWSRIYPGADWHEREAWDMFGIRFDGHPHLAHIYLPGDFEGHPLRKDFPLLARIVKPWPGLVDVEPMPGEDAEDDAEAAAE